MRKCVISCYFEKQTCYLKNKGIDWYLVTDNRLDIVSNNIHVIEILMI